MPNGDLIKKKIKIDDLKEGDLHYDLKQKGIDIKIGVDVLNTRS